MSLKSMTGFGRGEASQGGMKVTAELGSVNRRQFDARVNVPRALAPIEPHILDRIHARVARGCVTGTIALSVSGSARARCVRVNREAARAYVRELRGLARSLSLRDDLSAADLVRLPDVVSCEEMPSDTERYWPLVRRALDGALDGVCRMRRDEGRALKKDLARRFAWLKRESARIAARAPRVVQRYRDALRKRLASAGIGNLGDEALRRDLALFAERSDITEELVRIGSHLQQADALMRGPDPAGRPLDFLCQELFREINTIGSKANDPFVSRSVVKFKSELEAVREQVQNVE